MEYQYELDARGLPCPVPVLRLKTAMAGIKKGDVIRLIADDPRSPPDVKAYVFHSRNRLLELYSQGDELVFLVEKC